MKSRLLFLALSALLIEFGSDAFSAEARQDRIPGQNEFGRIERLEILADLWGKIYLFHPEAVRGGLDYEQLLVDVLPEVETTKTTVELAATLNRMLRALDDPLTFATASASNEGGASGETKSLSSGNPTEVVYQRLTSSVGYVDLTDVGVYSRPSFLVEFQHAVKDLGSIAILIVDLRWEGAT